MLAPNTKRFLIRTAIAGASVYLLLAGFCLFGKGHLCFNGSPSVPMGFYSRTSDHSAPYVWVCLDGDALKEAKEHGLPSGSCPNGSMPLLKPVYHPANGIVEFTLSGFVNDGQIVPNTVAKKIGSNGLPLTHYPYGTYREQPGLVWVVSTYSPDSFDSRYYGPIKQSQIVSYSRRVLVLP